jgi:hypothetical protein
LKVNHEKSRIQSRIGSGAGSESVPKCHGSRTLQKKGWIFLPGHSAIVQTNFTIEFDPELCLERVNLQHDRMAIIWLYDNSKKPKELGWNRGTNSKIIKHMERPT